MRTSPKNNPHLPIAIIGIGPIFPKGYGLKQFSSLMVQGEDAIQKVPESHWSPEEYFDSDPKCPDHVYAKRGGFISPVPFDPSEFGIPPTSIEATDTSQLLGLQATKMALNNAGYGTKGKAFDRDRTSVILGVTGTQELVIPLSTRLGYPQWKTAMQKAGLPDATIEVVTQSISDAYLPWQENSFPGLLGNVVAGRICNRLDFGGTNCVVDAACASSMSALNLALLELSSGRSDMVISGGVDTLNDIFMHMCFSKTQILSPTGDIRPFSKNADGTLLGEGIGILVLKRLADAEEDGDRIYAVIKALGTSSDGKSQSIYAPNSDGQVKALTNAYRNADIDPATVELIEAHGTGTRVGDQVEFKALQQVLGSSRDPEHPPCALGSIKSQIGHTKAAAGSAGLIKTALALYHKTIPPTLKASEPDPDLGLPNSRFYLPDQASPWFPNGNHPRRAGVSAFGFGGSNFHTVLEEYSPQKPSILWDGSVELFAMSGKSRLDILDGIRKLDKKLSNRISPAVFSQEAAQARTRFSNTDPFRLAFAVKNNPANPGVPSGFLSSVAEAIEKHGEKSHFQMGNVFFGSSSCGKIGFLFPGQGSQYVGMGRELTVHFPTSFQAIVDADNVWEGTRKLSDYIWPTTTGDPSTHEKALRDTRIAQPTIAAISIAMFRLLALFNVSPDAVCGHSFGEISALYASGKLKFNDYISLAQLRGKLMSDAGKRHDSGAMLAVQAPLSQIESTLLSSGTEGVVLANKNAPEQGVLSGESTAIDQLIPVFQRMGVRTVKLPVSAAFHSHFVQQARKPFAKALEKIDFLPSEIPVFSNSSALPYPDAVSEIRKILADQITHPVNFFANIINMYESGIRTFIEVGPKNILSGLTRATLKGRDVQVLSMDHSSGKRSGLLDFASALCHLSSIGYPVDVTKWGGTAKTSSPPGMVVSVSGANPKRKKKDSPIPKSLPIQTTSTSSISVLNRTENAIMDTSSTEAADKRCSKLPSATKDQSVSSKGQPKMVNNLTRPENNIRSEALKAVQEGLKSLQRLQEQTTQAHKQFLETQSEANRSLMAIMQQTGILSHVSSETPPALLHATENPDQVSSQIKSTTTPLSLDKEATSFMSIAGDETKQNASNAIENQTRQRNLAENDNENIESLLVEVVSELTGYPAETLGLDMDIEADLGIDSIKRVEILSAFEEKMPEIPPVSPDVMGTLKTLRQICEYLSQKSPQSNPEATVTMVTQQQSSGTDIENVLVEVVSELTGYPAETLGLDMDIEADLGIDSIKRVEILSAFEEKIPEIPPVSPDVMGTLKTLRQICEYLGTTSSQSTPLSSGKEQADTDHVTHTIPVPLTRYVIHPISNTKKPTSPVTYPKDGFIYITGKTPDLGLSLQNELESRNIPALYKDMDDLTDNPVSKPVAGLIIIANRPSHTGIYNWDTESVFLKNAFLLAKKFSVDLQQNENGKASTFFGTVSFLDGAFGFLQKDFRNPIQGGLAGLTKTAELEWDPVFCRSFDIEPAWDTWKEVASALADEIEMPDADHKEIGLQMGSRFVLSLSPETKTSLEKNNLEIQPGDVVVVTGGARGISAHAAKAFAKAFSPTLVLLGRSPEPIHEPAWLTALEQPSEIKRAILEHEFSGSVKTPAVLETAYRKHMANREILSNLKELELSGSKVVYRSVDIRDKKEVRLVLNSVATTLGPVRAVIHGAGVLEDRFITDKKLEQFNRVFDTKVAGLQALLDALQDASLKVLVMFSSVSARMGNPGQADYAMANEVLNKIAASEANRRKECKVLSINWGPWDGGMVTDSLKKEFAQRNIGLIPMDKGVDFLLKEMAFDRNGPVEVVAGALLANNAVSTVSTATSVFKENDTPKTDKIQSMVTAFRRDIGMATCPILSSHIIDGKPVVPFALMGEWIGHGALHENPGLQLYGIDNMRLLKGIRLESGSRTIRLLAGKAQRSDNRFHVDVEIRNGKPDAEVIHSKAMAILADSPASAPSHTLSDFSLTAENNPYPRSIEEVYDKILFHGNDLRGIRQIDYCSPTGMSATLCPSPSPETWMKQPPRSRWISDPLVLDAAFQMVSVWCYENHGDVSLPSFFASYRQFRKEFPNDMVTAIFKTSKISSHKVTGDFYFFDSKEGIIARMTGYEAIMDASLYKAFKPDFARSA